MPDSTFVTTGTYPTRGGNAVQLLIDGEAAFRRVCEAIEAANQSVWATITFMWADFQMPDGRGSALEVLDRAAQRGVDVRLIFWRPDDVTASHRRNAFWGAPEHLGLLEAFAPKVSIRWDCAETGFCQHQKTWLIDGQIAFLGGLNLNPNSVVAAGHFGEKQNHDLYIELVGLAVADVHHNFVQRWNEASEQFTEHGLWGEDACTALEFPSRLPLEQGSALVQIQRTIHAGQFQNQQAPVGGLLFNISLGEQTIFVQCCAAIGFAKRSIYIENQYLEIIEIVEALLHALKRGVEVVLLLPIAPDRTYTTPEQLAFLESRAKLGEYKNFMLAGIAGLGADGCRKPVWVHSKLMLIDDTWAMIGSANWHRWSMFGNCELNAAILCADTVRGFRVALFLEHLALETSNLDDVRAMQKFRQVADANQLLLLQKNHVWQGLAVALDVKTYGKTPPVGW
jgi:cardiolipin synthase A/B